MGKKDRIEAKKPTSNNRSSTGASSSSSSGVSKKSDHIPTSKQKRHGQVDGYKKNWTAFNEQLRAYGLCLRTIGSDGNCLFRSIADQLCGKQDEHMKYRQQIVEYEERHPLDFAPFMVDETFEAYCAKMKKNGTWGGAAELAAASRAFGVHITIHQYNAPRLENIYDPACVTPDPNHPDDLPLPVTRDTRTIHLSYHDAEHYSSVRNLNDAHSFEPATPIVIPSAPIVTAASSSSSSSSPNLTHQELIVTQSTSCTNLHKVRKLLAENWNDADAVVEILYAEEQMGLDMNIDYDEHAKAQEEAIKQQAKDEEEKEARRRLKQIEEEKDSQRRKREAEAAAKEQAAKEQADRVAQQRQQDESSSNMNASESSESSNQPNGHVDANGLSATAGSQDATDTDDAADEEDDDAESNVSDSKSVIPSSVGSSSTPSKKAPVVKRVSGRDRRMAQKQAKMLADKQKRLNRGATKKEKAQANAIEETTIAIGSVRI